MPSSPAAPDFSKVLPNRPIAVRPPQTVGPLSAAGLFFLLFGLLTGALWWLGPDIVRDWRIGGEVVRADAVRIEEARCRSRLFLLTVCDIAFIDARSADASRQTLWYFFIDRADREPIVLVRPKSTPASDPAAITTNLGLDKLYHRLFTLGLILAVLGLCIAMSVQVLRQGATTRQALAALSGQRLRPVVVGIEGGIPIAHKRRRWTYVYEQGGSQRAFVELAKGNDPLFVRPDGKRALALIGPGGGVPLLLDVNLSSLDLTEAEKEAFFKACREALEGQLVA